MRALLNVLLGLLAAAAMFPLLFASGLFLLGTGHRHAGWAYLAVVLTCRLASSWRSRKRRESNLEPPSRSLRFRKSMVSLLLSLLAGAILTVLSYSISARPPGQNWVISHFQANKAELDQMKEMIRTDRIERVIGPRLFDPISAPGVSPERASQYKRLMRTTAVSRIDRWSDGTVHLWIASWGVANQGWRMSIVWAENPPAPLRPSVDPPRPTGVPAHIFSRIEGPWYVYLTW